MMQFLTLLVIVGTIAGGLFLIWRPYWVFVLIVCMFPVEQLLQAYIPGLTARSSWINFAIGGLAGFGVVSRVMRRAPTLAAYNNPVTMLTLALYAFWYLGIVYTPVVAQEYVLESIGMTVSYQTLFLILLPLLIIDADEFRRMLGGVMFLGSVVAGLILINPHSEFHSGRLILDLGMVGGGVQRHGNPLALADMGGMIALIAALIRPASATQMYLLLRVAAFVAGMGLAIGSGSRGQVLAAGACGILFFPMARRLASPKQFVVAVIGLGVLLIALYVVFKLFVGQQNALRWDSAGILRDTNVRFMYVSELMQAYFASPASWLLGLGTYAYVAISPDTHATYVHNVVAEAFFEHGLVGGVLFVAICWWTFKYGKSLWAAHRHDDSMRSAVAILLALSVYYLLLGLKQGSLGNPTPFYWWLIVAKLATHERLVPTAQTDPLEVEIHDDDVLDRSPQEQEADAKGYALGY